MLTTCHIAISELMGPLFGPRPTDAEVENAIRKRLKSAGFDLSRPFKSYLLLDETFVFAQEPRISLGRMLPNWDWAAYAFAVLYWALVALIFAGCLQ